jgi:hypothetical protein
LDKVPAGSESASRSVGDEEEPVGRENDFSMKRSSGRRNRRNRRSVRRADMDCSGSWKRGNGNSKWKRVRDGRYGDVLELKQRRMVGRQSRRKPHVVVHLNVERRFERVDKWGMGVIEITEIRSV